MIRKACRLIGILIIVAICLWIAIKNSTQVTVSLLPGKETTGNLGVILLAVFAFGILLAAVFAAYASVRSSLRERRLQKLDQQRREFFDGVTEARAFISSGEWNQAMQIWSKIIKKDPTNIIARIELSRSLEGDGQLREALRVIDEARTADPDNVEVLFRAAELNLALNNRTAAIDNLALILYYHPNIRATRLARDLSEQLGRIEDALEYQQQLEQLNPRDPSHALVVARLKLQQLIASEENQERSLVKELRSFVKSWPEHAPGWEKLADQLLAENEPLQAADALEQAARLTGSPAMVSRIGEILIGAGTPDRAVSKVRSVLRRLTGQNRLAGEIELIRLYLSLQMLPEALGALQELPHLADIEQTVLTPDLNRQQTILHGLWHCFTGKASDTAGLWKQLDRLDNPDKIPVKSMEQLPPGPESSTP